MPLVKMQGNICKQISETTLAVIDCSFNPGQLMIAGRKREEEMILIEMYGLQ